MITAPSQEPTSRRAQAAMLVMLGAGLLLRLRLAWLTFLNPDEALHYYLAHQSSIKLAYEASLTTAHPPLMILLLHFWSVLGSSEFFLRIPFVVAGTLFCWAMFLWMRRVAAASSAWYALALFLFAPPLISLSAEIRQYAFLLFFCAGALYFFEHSFARNSAVSMILSGVALYLALLNHYSALIFAAALGIYALALLAFRRPPVRIVGWWIAMQAGALAICAVLFRTQVSRLRASGLPSEIAGTWLCTSIFHPGEERALVFAWTRTLRLFRYLFSHGTIGILGLLLFTFAIFVMFWPRGERSQRARGLCTALLLILPFLVTLSLAFAAIYPYGGTRHDSVLALFAFPGIAIGLDRLRLGPLSSQAKFLKCLLLAVALVICNFFPSATGPYIRPRNQDRALMQQAMNSLRVLPANSVVFTDDQGSMALNYYLCGEQMPLPFYSKRQLFLTLRCADKNVLIATGTQTGFDRADFPALLTNAWNAVPNTSTLYLFQSGWIDDRESQWLTELSSLGGAPKNFGANVIVCPLRKSTRSSALIRSKP
jgi:hypothetical protein